MIARAEVFAPALDLPCSSVLDGSMRVCSCLTVHAGMRLLSYVGC
jgi:hypothetical protein